MYLATLLIDGQLRCWEDVSDRGENASEVGTEGVGRVCFALSYSQYLGRDCDGGDGDYC